MVSIAIRPTPPDKRASAGSNTEQQVVKQPNLDAGPKNRQSDSHPGTVLPWTQITVQVPDRYKPHLG